MPDIAKMLKEEIRRLARKEVKDATASLNRSNAELKKTIVQQKRRIDALERSSKRLGRVSALASVPDDGVDRPGRRLRITSTTIRNGKLLGVSGQSVYQWERKNSQLRLRNTTRDAFADIKDFGVREAKKRLNEMGTGRKGKRKGRA